MCSLTIECVLLGVLRILLPLQSAATVDGGAPRPENPSQGAHGGQGRYGMIECVLLL